MDEGRKARRERRYERRVDKWRAREEVVAVVREYIGQQYHQRQQQQRSKEKLEVVAWNVQGMSLVARGRRKCREVAEYARWCGWDVVLLSEVRAEGNGVVLCLVGVPLAPAIY